MTRHLLRGIAMAFASGVLVSGCEMSVYDVPLPGGADVGDDSYTVTVEFRDVLDLVPQSAVKVDDVTVGRVESIALDGWTAKVVVRMRGDVDLPDNALASIRQTSLLGEKFVSLSPPKGQATGTLDQGDVIPLARSGRNPEVEEVLGAISLLLNGGGVAQVKTISTEFANVLDGNEQSVKSLLTQMDRFMGRLDTHRRDIVRAIEALNRLAKSLKQQELTIERALDRMPAALDSIDKQREDLVRMLEALGELSDVGTRVIRESTENTVRSLESLAPVLTKLADAGESLPKSFNVFLTYPFVDAAIGRTPAEARNTHLGDYTNLNARLDVDLTKPLVVPGLPGVDLPEVSLPPLTGEDGLLGPRGLTNAPQGGGAARGDDRAGRHDGVPPRPGGPGGTGGSGGGGDGSGKDADIAGMLLQGVVR